MDDMQFSMPFGISMENAVITKPYSISIDASNDRLENNSDECFFMLVDRHGKWRINTLLKGFAKNLSGLASSFSSSGDIILIGKSKADLLTAFGRMKEIGGGIVVADGGEIIKEVSLPLNGLMSDKTIEDLMIDLKDFSQYLREKGYQFEDPFHSLLFFSTTHLPYIRITPRGMYDVMNKMILFPTIMR